MEFPCSPLGWADDAPNVHPTCSSCCYIPRRHRGFFRYQVGQLPAYDEVMRDLVCHCHHDSENDHPVDSEIGIDHGNIGLNFGVGVGVGEDETSDAYINASSVCPSVWNPQTGGEEENREAQGKFGTTSPSTSRSVSSASSGYSSSSGSGSGFDSGSGSGYSKKWHQPWHRFDSGFQPNIHWPRTGFWRNYERSQPHQSFNIKQHQQRENRYVPNTR